MCNKIGKEAKVNSADLVIWIAMQSLLPAAVPDLNIVKRHMINEITPICSANNGCDSCLTLATSKHTLECLNGAIFAFHLYIARLSLSPHNTTIHLKPRYNTYSGYTNIIIASSVVCILPLRRIIYFQYFQSASTQPNIHKKNRDQK